MNRIFGPFSRRRLLSTVMLALAWCALWGSISVANAASGLVVGFLASARLVGTDGTGGIRVKPLLHFGALVAIDLARSSVSVALRNIHWAPPSVLRINRSVGCSADCRARMKPATRSRGA